jgi:hypothetical protein
LHCICSPFNKVQYFAPLSTFSMSMYPIKYLPNLNKHSIYFHFRFIFELQRRIERKGKRAKEIATFHRIEHFCQVCFQGFAAISDTHKNLT